MHMLVEPQPSCCRAALPLRTVRVRGRFAVVIERVLAFDPQPVYARAEQSINPFRRIQTRREMSMELLFPKKQDGMCDCGCGQSLKGKQRRWATEDCSLFG